MSPLLSESEFARSLSLERRRSERTGEPFALMLLELDTLHQTLNAEDCDALARLVSIALRDTDLTGWHEERSTIGAILTALNGTKPEILETVVAKRIRDALSGVVGTAEIQAIRISCYMFPEDQRGDSGRDWKPDRLFYSDRSRGSSESSFPSVSKRAMDIVGSLVALVGLLPLFIVIAALVKLTSPGPVFYRQERYGLFGKEFTFLKFRSMYTNNDPEIHKEYVRNLIDNNEGGSDGSFKIRNDPRVTPLGAFLRKNSLDELPQFINVLQGDMSLVGPRPPIPYEFERYCLWHRQRLLRAKPGITGEWQVCGRSRTTFDEMVRMDLRYIRNQSFWLDLKILIKTPLAVLSGDGAY